MKSPSYWIAVTSLAIGAATFGHSTNTTPPAAPKVGLELSVADLTPPDSIAAVFPIPEPSRAAFLGLGIVAVAATYRRAWLNLKRSRTPSA
ncbi:MAG: hypothetical protein KDK99_07705 [Verrucomicrobiales bacterium]|nr:hypothetical protein [Verrucomicrobiales bacterium]